ncbi:MAG TPA: alcohol dehydrogenase family protein [Ktedonosporobacter sp.]|jgi:2-desacetyl-2-hydroxyethyl bacteriochlorophyllide A dehydrogenase|nr:alcohol dehydrogenase family protein [Ktedonosporobacter sp.]
MKGIVWYAPYDVRVEELPLPQLQGARDAVIRVTRAAICGTDLHPYRGEIPGFQVGVVLGHEFTGIVEEVGKEVKNFRVGDRVLASDLIACGECWFCQKNWHYQCQHVSLFGYGTVVGHYFPGGQAEYVRIPYADVVLSPIPDSLNEEQILFVGDILTTGYTCAYEAGITPGDTVAVVGCGPVGLFALMSAYHLGAKRVIAIDPDPQRRAVAQDLGGYALAPNDEVVQHIQEITHGRGADAVLEAVGTDSALTTALTIARPKGTISVVGAHHSQAMPFPSGLAFGRELTIRFSVGDPIRWRDQLLSLLEKGQLDPTRIISHRLPLSQAIEGYQLFDQHHALKVVLT